MDRRRVRPPSGVPPFVPKRLSVRREKTRQWLYRVPIYYLVDVTEVRITQMTCIRFGTSSTLLHIRALINERKSTFSLSHSLPVSASPSLLMPHIPTSNHVINLLRTPFMPLEIGLGIRRASGAATRLHLTQNLQPRPRQVRRSNSLGCRLRGCRPEMRMRISVPPDR